MATELQREQRELADYIRAGASRGPQCFGSYFDERGGSCALGAVYEGVYHLPREHGKLIPDHLERLFRCLDEMTKKCPQGCSKRLPIAPARAAGASTTGSAFSRAASRALKTRS
jgi:hypothetical protein